MAESNETKDVDFFVSSLYFSDLCSLSVLLANHYCYDCTLLSERQLIKGRLLYIYIVTADHVLNGGNLHNAVNVVLVYY